ncbi:adenylyl-sulfate kinase [Paraburkholderia sp. CNPSo 3281]|uniref:adenylyl-sulfate kinase n=1 Tax=Paraburkholderia sp. CNPSo 3281 TaxID=2940933 RepID=UPI0020B77BA3|nr:adenylyl-sulfate kinase [Paraburkholderia sp. CNPSo 3281]MCP3720360.1 adenylyl-sulfate kinase [Paraburkholderia sp. CNPSo 3281]
METGTSTGVVIWLTGMSGAGKSTIARALVDRLQTFALHATMLDGDVLRTGLNSDLGFSETERTENLRRIAHVAALFCNEGFVAVAATISPEPEHRDNARRIVGDASFVEVFIDTPLAVCERRDPKGLYRRARRGEIPQFTGLGAPYHPPVNPDLVIRTQGASVQECAQQIVDHLVVAERIALKLGRHKDARQDLHAGTRL